MSRYSLTNSCPECNSNLPEYGPRLFSFNSNYGSCPSCNGLGVEDKIAEELLIQDRNKSLREGALVITAPNGYIIYSQVTMDILNQVCNHHGFNVDIKWKDLTQEQKRIVLYGSDEIKIPYGKHTLESRMKWSGITAKPREEGFYKGIIPVMEIILKRDRNPNVLRFTKSVICKTCQGNRIRKEALAVKFKGKNIAELTKLSIDELEYFLAKQILDSKEQIISKPILDEILKRISLLQKLGLGYLSLNRESTTLSEGEAQRIRLATQAGSGLQGMIYVLDEPSIGLHQKNSRQLIELLKRLRDNGNTIIVVEHDEDIIRQADYLIDLGPGAGINGGELIFAGYLKDFFAGKTKNLQKSLTYNYLIGNKSIKPPSKRRPGNGDLTINKAGKNNLQNISVSFKTGALNVVSGVSGSGKKSLVKEVLAENMFNYLNNKIVEFKHCSNISGINKINKIIEIDQSPIGKTPRSNPATYTGLFDHIRDLFASLPESKAKKWKKGRFSFNVKGGRCEDCQGAGVKLFGMHFLGNVDVVCETCSGKRFNYETLGVLYRSKSIYDVLGLSVLEARTFFADQPKIHKIITSLTDIGLDYIKLGQVSTSLSGGEAQRIKLAAELSKPSTGKTLYVLGEPTTGLHFHDVKVLINSLQKIVDQGNTIICIEHNPDFLLSADWIVDLGPESGKNGGRIIGCGSPEEIMNILSSHTGRMLRNHISPDKYTVIEEKSSFSTLSAPIELEGVTTNNLKNIDVSIPKEKLTVITGVSGSGKSSLAFDTLFAESQNRYIENLSTYSRRFMKNIQKGEMKKSHGFSPAIAVNQKSIAKNPRSTLGTITEIYDYYRLLYARVGQAENTSYKALTTQHFSFNHHIGACEKCKGLGLQTICDSEKIITHPEKSILNGSMDGTKTGMFYGDPYGQYVATLQAVGVKRKINFAVPWQQLKNYDKEIIMIGTGEDEYKVVWEFKRKDRAGTHLFTKKWPGIVAYVNEEYERKHADNRGDSMMNVMKEVTCTDCKGERLNKNIRQIKFSAKNISELSKLSVKESIHFFSWLKGKPENCLSKNILLVINDIIKEVLNRLNILQELGLGYLTIDRRSETLSGGEARRLRLAGLLSSELTGITFVLDEPTIGLHPSDTKKLSRKLLQLRDIGNTVVVVERDKDIINLADNIIDIGPGAGINGGEIVAQGTMQEIINQKDSITGKYLSGEKGLVLLKKQAQPERFIKIYNACVNNLKHIDLNIPSPGLIAITGVSGSGKSSLLFDVIAESAKAKKPVNCKNIEGLEFFDEILLSDQSPVGTSPLSTPVTYIGVFDKIRELFAQTALAQERNYSKSWFSYNNKNGQCEKCKGHGQEKISMGFLADIRIECEACKGKRYKKKILEVFYHGKSIFDVLQMTFTDAIEFFKNETGISSAFKLLAKTGLDYLQLGQASNTLSGGESQRLKLAKSLLHSKMGKNLYLIDEPTTGLHFSDIEKLLILFRELVISGHSLLVIEHNPDIIKNADWIIDLGPEGGDNGGKLIFEGKPDKIINCKDSSTGIFLKYTKFGYHGSIEF